MLNHVEFVFFRINWQKYARNKAKKETSRSNQKWIPFFPFYSCGCKILIVLPNRYLTEFIGLVNARKIKSQWKPCVCASLKMCFSIDSLAIHLQTFIDCESLKCKQHKKKTFTFCITTRINQWRDFQHLNCLPTLISHIHVCINLYCCFCTVYGQYIISRKCAHSFLIRRQWRHSQWKKSKKKWTYLNDKSAYAIYISNTLTHVRVRVRAFVEPN